MPTSRKEVIAQNKAKHDENNKKKKERKNSRRGNEREKSGRDGVKKSSSAWNIFPWRRSESRKNLLLKARSQMNLTEEGEREDGKDRSAVDLGEQITQHSYQRQVSHMELPDMTLPRDGTMMADILSQIHIDQGSDGGLGSPVDKVEPAPVSSVGYSGTLKKESVRDTYVDSSDEEVDDAVKRNEAEDTFDEKYFQLMAKKREREEKLTRMKQAREERKRLSVARRREVEEILKQPVSPRFQRTSTGTLPRLASNSALNRPPQRHNTMLPTVSFPSSADTFRRSSTLSSLAPAGGCWSQFHLLRAISEGDIEGVGLALENVDVDEPLGYLEHTALKWAQVYKQKEVERFLLAQGATPEV